MRQIWLRAQALRGSPNILTLRAVAFSDLEAHLLMDLCDGTLVDVLDAAQGEHAQKGKLLSVSSHKTNSA